MSRRRGDFVFRLRRGRIERVRLNRGPSRSALRADRLDVVLMEMRWSYGEFIRRWREPRAHLYPIFRPLTEAEAAQRPHGLFSWERFTPHDSVNQIRGASARITHFQALTSEHPRPRRHS